MIHGSNVAVRHEMDAIKYLFGKLTYMKTRRDVVILNNPIKFYSEYYFSKILSLYHFNVDHLQSERF